MIKFKNSLISFIFCLIFWGCFSGISLAEENLLLSYRDESLDSKPNKLFQVEKIGDNKASPQLIFLSNNKFVSNRTYKPQLFPQSKAFSTTSSKLIKVEIEKRTTLYDEITLDDESTDFNLEDLNSVLASKDPCELMVPMGFEEQKIPPFINRAKTVYFLTSLSTMIGQSGQIQDAFTKGKGLTGGGTSKSDQYGYENIGRNLLNPFSRAIKGAKVDDSGPTVNYAQHPLFGFGVASYLTASGASAKEVFLVTMLDNFLFEYVVEGTYVAPSGIDFLTTSGGCVAGYFATKYIFKKPFKAFLDKTAYLKEKCHMTFYPIIEPGQTGNGVRIGSQVTFKH